MKCWGSILQGWWSLLGLPVTKFSFTRLPGLSSWLGLPRTKFWSPSDCGSSCSFGALVCSMSKIRWLCWPHWLALALLVPLACFGMSLLCCAISPEVRRFGSIPWLGCLRAAAFCETNGIYTSMLLRRNECCFHVRKAVVLRKPRKGVTDLFHLEPKSC